MRAEAQLLDLVPDLRLGDKITLARVAVGKVAGRLLADADARVVLPALLNPRLRESQLVAAIRDETAGRALLEVVAITPTGEVPLGGQSVQVG